MKPILWDSVQGQKLVCCNSDISNEKICILLCPVSAPGRVGLVSCSFVILRTASSAVDGNTTCSVAGCQTLAASKVNIGSWGPNTCEPLLFAAFLSYVCAMNKSPTPSSVAFTRNYSIHVEGCHFQKVMGW